MSSKIFKEVFYKDFVQFYQDLVAQKITELRLNNYTFRGVSKESYKLIPSALRKEGLKKINKLSLVKTDISQVDKDNLVQIAAEFNIVYKFYNIANRQGLNIPQVIDFVDWDTENLYSIFKNLKTWIPEKYYEIFAIAQHFGIPTRFLDWTFDINTATLFAVEGVHKRIVEDSSIDVNKENFSIWLLNYKYLPLYRNKLNCNIRLIVPKYHWNNYITMQKGLFTIDIIKIDKNKRTALPKVIENGKATLNNDYYSEGLEEKILNSDINKYKGLLPKETLLYKFSFPYSCINQAYNLLKYFGYSYSSIYPGLHNIVDCIEYEQNFTDRFCIENLRVIE